MDTKTNNKNTMIKYWRVAKQFRITFLRENDFTEWIFTFLPTFQTTVELGFKNRQNKNLPDFKNYRKSSIRSRPLIQVYSIRGRVIGGSVQALIIDKSLKPSKLPYLDHYELVEIKKFALEIIIFEIPLRQV